MLKVSLTEALTMLKSAKTIKDQRKRLRALTKLAKCLNAGFEKNAFLGLSAAAIAAIVSSLASAGYIGYDMYSDSAERTKAQEELAKLRANLEQQQTAKLKTLRPRVFMASPKPTAPPPQPMQQAPQPMQKAPNEQLTFGPGDTEPQVQEPQLPDFMQNADLSPQFSRLLGSLYGGDRPGMGAPRKTASSLRGIEKRAVLGSIVMAALRPLLSAGGRAAGAIGKKLLSHTTRQMLRSGAKTGARGIGKQLGRSVGGSKVALGNLLQRVSPGPFGALGRVGRYGSRLAQRGGRIVSSPTTSKAYGRLLSKKLGRGAVSGAAGLGRMSLLGTGLQGASDWLDPPAQYSPEEMTQAGKLQSWLEATRGGSQAPVASMSMPGFDLTEISGNGGAQ